jgi:glycosyltransferase involved in cell wall biosynthesis
MAWARQLARNEDEVLLYFFMSGIGAHEEEAQHLSTYVYRGSSAITRLIGVPFWTMWRCRKDGPDVLLTVGTYANVSALIGRQLTRTNILIVITEHTVPTLFRRFEGKVGRLQALLARSLYRYADAAMSVSHVAATDLLVRHGLARDKCFVVPNPIIGELSSCHTWANWEKDEPLRVGFVGRLSPVKRPLLYLRVVAEIRARGINVVAVVIGDGPLRDAVAADAKRLGIPLELQPWSDHWDSAGLHCVVSTSEIEGLAIILIDATARGIPVAASSMALGVADAVIPGVTGILAPTDDVLDLAGAVIAAAQLAPPNASGWLSRWSIVGSTRSARAVLERALAGASTDGEARRGQSC